MPEPANRYAIVIAWSEKDGGWIASVPDLKSCSAFASTPEKAVAEVSVAIDAWLASAREAGLPIPEPRFQPPVRKAIDRETRRRVLEEVRASARGRAKPGPDAARSQDFLYDDDGLPG